MRSARLFLPLSISLFIKRVRVRDPNRGSGGTSRLITRARRGIDSPQGRRNEPFSSGTEDRRVSRDVRESTWLAQRPIACWLEQTRYVSAHRMGGPPHEIGYLAAALGAFAPYFERPCLRSLTPPASSAPRTM